MDVSVCPMTLNAVKQEAVAKTGVYKLKKAHRSEEARTDRTPSGKAAEFGPPHNLLNCPAYK